MDKCEVCGENAMCQYVTNGRTFHFCKEHFDEVVKRMDEKKKGEVK